MTLFTVTPQKHDKQKPHISIARGLATLFTLFFSISSFSMASTRLEMNSEILVEPSSGLTYQRDNNGNIWPNITNLEGSSLTTYLTNFVVYLREDKSLRGSAFLINLSLPEFGKSEVLKTVGFTLHQASDSHLLWKIQNDSPTLDFMKSSSGTRVISVKGGNS